MSYIHPEQREDEVYLGDHTPEDIKHEWGWKTTRLGKNSYDKNGNIIADDPKKPTFIKKSEVEVRLREEEESKRGHLGQAQTLRSMLDGTWNSWIGVMFKCKENERKLREDERKSRDLIRQAARDGFKDLVLKIIDKRIQATKKGYDMSSLTKLTNIEIQDELSRLRKEIADLDAD